MFLRKTIGIRLWRKNNSQRIKQTSLCSSVISLCGSVEKLLHKVSQSRTKFHKGKRMNQYIHKILFYRQRFGFC